MRVRLRFEKLGKIRFTSHRDLARVWERALRKAGLTVAYTEGFSPRPKLHFGLALPTGHESLAEYVDVDLALAGPLGGVDLALAGPLGGVDLALAAPLGGPGGDASDELAWLARLAHTVNDVLPPGLSVTGTEPVASGTPSLQEDVVACSWGIEPHTIDGDAVAAAIERLVGADTVVVTRTRKGQSSVDDVRPAIEALAVGARRRGADPAGRAPAADDDVDGGGAVAIEAVLATKPRGLRPSELLDALFPDVPVGERLAWRTVRLAQFIERDGSRCELPPLAQAPAPHAQVVCA